MKSSCFLKITKNSLIILLLFFLAFSSSCHMNKAPKEQTLNAEKGVDHVEWSDNAVIYEVNIRQFTKEGTFNAFSEHLPRLKELGVEILWLMPINPIGEVNRKGELGSYYSIKDYLDVNPEFGNMDDFKNLVSEIHEIGLKVIIDWVPNHSSWDNPLTVEHPEFYVKNENGEFVSPFDWTDVIQFDYDEPGLREYMIDAMKFWLTETDIDGFRCDVAHMVPVDFWNTVRPALMSVKPVFLLAESDQPFLHEIAFDVTYDWRFHHIMNEIASGKRTVKDIDRHFAFVDSVYPANSILMQFTSNHDENSWNGTSYERLGNYVKTYAALTFAVPGMPLIYNGQEACLNKRLEFFTKDVVEWQDCEMFDFYKKLIQFRKDNPALWSGDSGGSYIRLTTNSPEKIYAIKRLKGENEVIAIFNLSSESIDVDLSELFEGKNYVNYFEGVEEDYSKLKKLDAGDFVFYSK
jgi:glycosidase